MKTAFFLVLLTLAVAASPLVMFANAYDACETCATGPLSK